MTLMEVGLLRKYVLVAMHSPGGDVAYEYLSLLKTQKSLIGWSLMFVCFITMVVFFWGPFLLFCFILSLFNVAMRSFYFNIFLASFVVFACYLFRFIPKCFLFFFL
ncbi:hypothetical protein QBC42DRAFT_80986 [Cladorrhinum samala]|uniref:Uncharacterized protein n=1 Tax=Cladorrhinum samala TaxID=585594 RepID=A0AAV9HQD8_9PEZI|nr:hypothetical protein QBC42DRAFT_80986 [Cladorrhinum samala]